MNGIFGVRGCEEGSRATGWVAGRVSEMGLLRGRQMWNGKREFIVLCWFELPSGYPSRDCNLVAGCAILTKSRGKVCAGDKIVRVFTKYKDAIGYDQLGRECRHGSRGQKDRVRGNMAVEVWEPAQEAEKEQRVRLGANQGSVSPEERFRKKIGPTGSDAVGRLGKDKTENCHLALRY